MSGEGGAPGVVPVGVVGGQLLGGRGLDNINPFGQLHLAGPGIKDKVKFAHIEKSGKTPTTLHLGPIPTLKRGYRLKAPWPEQKLCLKVAA